MAGASLAATAMKHEGASGALKTPTHPLRKVPRRSIWESLDALALWLFGRAPDSYSLRRRTAIAVNAAPFGRIWDLLQIGFTILGLVTYVKSTYDSSSIDELDEFLAILFTVDFLLRWYIAPSRITYFYDTAYPAIDILCVLPTYLQWGYGWAAVGGVASFTFVRVVRCLRLLRILRTFRMLQYGTTPLGRQIMLLALSTFSMMYINAGALNLIEVQFWTFFSMGQPQSAASDFNFGNAFWFSLVTMTTIGWVGKPRGAATRDSAYHAHAAREPLPSVRAGTATSCRRRTRGRPWIRATSSCRSSWSPSKSRP